MPIFTGLTQLETTTNPEYCPLYPHPHPFIHPRPHYALSPFSYQTHIPASPSSCPRPPEGDEVAAGSGSGRHIYQKHNVEFRIQSEDSGGGQGVSFCVEVEGLCRFYFYYSGIGKQIVSRVSIHAMLCEGMGGGGGGVGVVAQGLGPRPKEKGGAGL